MQIKLIISKLVKNYKKIWTLFNNLIRNYKSPIINYKKILKFILEENNSFNKN